MNYKPVIFGIKGLKLSQDEAEFFGKAKPVGFILFSRNIESPKQVKALVKSLRKVLDNPHAPILIDQEGGRVARLKEPWWYHPLPAAVFGEIADKNIEDAKKACWLNALLIAHDLNQLGINVDCAPVADVPVQGAHDVIGNRAFSYDKHTVTILAQTMADALTSRGIAPIIKHIPGHGRAGEDSHHNLPKVDDDYKTLLENDFYPFMNMNKISWAMTAHVIYSAIDSINSATQSVKVINVIRNTIGFKGLIITDCITMKALSGSMMERAHRSLEAGCDIVLCSMSEIEVMQQIVEGMESLSAKQMALITDSCSQPARANKNHKQHYNELVDLMRRYNIKTPVLGHDPTELSSSRI